MQIAFYTEARRVGISPQQPSLGQIVLCHAAAVQNSDHAAFTPMLPFTLRRVELASAHSNQAWDRLYLL